jgi:hypothetical protein
LFALYKVDPKRPKEYVFLCNITGIILGATPDSSILYNPSKMAEKYTSPS